jgi:acyl-CoA synthetase (AMP-forming)/AMP-acid ligase II
MDGISTPADLWRSLRERARPHAASLAISSPWGGLTFDQVFRAAEVWARELALAGVGPGTVVGLCLPNCLGFVPAFLAVTRLSATAALLPQACTPSEFEAVAQRVPISWLIVHPDGCDPGRGLLVGSSRPLMLEGTSNVLGLSPTRLCGAAQSCLKSPGTDLVAGAALLKFTKGSTGVRKCIALGADNLVAEAGNIATTLGLTPADGIGAPVSLSHSYGFDLGVLAMLWSGAGLVLGDRFRPRRTLDDLTGRGITVFLGVPRLYALLLKSLRPGSAPPLRGIRYLLTCTAPLPPEVGRAWDETFAIPLCEHYGTSETGALANQHPAWVRQRPRSVGRAVDGVQLRVCDPEGKDLPLGTPGEVVARGPAVARGYVMGRPDGLNPFRDGEYRTGDLGAMDADGFLFLRGRTSGVVSSGAADE